MQKKPIKNKSAVEQGLIKATKIYFNKKKELTHRKNYKTGQCTSITMKNNYEQQSLQVLINKLTTCGHMTKIRS